MLGASVLPVDANARDAQLSSHIRQVFRTHRERYGSPRIHIELREQGMRCSRKRVVRLMREAALSAKRKRWRVVTTNKGKRLLVTGTLLLPGIHAMSPRTSERNEIVPLLLL